MPLSSRQIGVRGVLFLMLVFLPVGCTSGCGPDSVAMPKGFEDITFGMSSLEIAKRNTTDFQNALVVWRDGHAEIYEEEDRPDKFVSHYEVCKDKALCDEVIYNLEKPGEGRDHKLTFIRFGGPMLSQFNGRLEYHPASQDRCDHYKALARELWSEPASTALDGRLELYEIKAKVWGAVLCIEGVGGELFIGRPERLRVIKG